MFKSNPKLLLTDNEIAAVITRRYKQNYKVFLNSERASRNTDTPLIERFGRVKILVTNGIVTLSGSVDHGSQKDSIEAFVISIVGVRGVNNNIEVLPTHIFWE